MDGHGYTQEDLAKVIGKSRSHLANTLRLLKLPDERAGPGAHRRAERRPRPRADRPPPTPRRSPPASLTKA